jgi:hypothetical protein
MLAKKNRDNGHHDPLNELLLGDDDDDDDDAGHSNTVGGVRQSKQGNATSSANAASTAAAAAGDWMLAENEEVFDVTCQEQREENINRALRRDIMLCTTWGICDAIDNISSSRESARARLDTGCTTTSSSSSSVYGWGGGGGGGSEMGGPESTASLQSQPQLPQSLSQGSWSSLVATESHRKIYLPLSLSGNTAFDFIDYSAAVFASIRDISGIDKETCVTKKIVDEKLTVNINMHCRYRRSFVIPSEDSQAAMLEKFTEGASGSFFYFTHDRSVLPFVQCVSHFTIIQHVHGEDGDPLRARSAPERVARLPRPLAGKPGVVVDAICGSACHPHVARAKLHYLCRHDQHLPQQHAPG